VKGNIDVEATIVGKVVVMALLLDERAHRLWAAAESVAIGYGGHALVSAATGLARETIRHGRRELAEGVEAPGRNEATAKLTTQFRPKSLVERQTSAPPRPTAIHQPGCGESSRLTEALSQSNLRSRGAQ